MYREQFLEYDELCAWFCEEIKESDLNGWEKDGYLVVQRTSYGNRYKLGSVIERVNSHYPEKRTFVYLKSEDLTSHMSSCQAIKDTFDKDGTRNFTFIGDFQHLLHLVCAGRVKEIVLFDSRDTPTIEVHADELKELQAQINTLSVITLEKKQRVSIDVTCKGSLHLLNFVSLFYVEDPDVVVYSRVHPDYEAVDKLYERMKNAFSLENSRHVVDIVRDLGEDSEARKLLKEVCIGKVKEIIVPTKNTFPIVALTPFLLEALQKSRLRLSIPNNSKKQFNYLTLECDNQMYKVHFPSRFAPLGCAPFTTLVRETTDSLQPKPKTSTPTKGLTQPESDTVSVSLDLPVYTTYEKLSVSVSKKKIDAWVKLGHVKAVKCDGVIGYNISDVKEMMKIEPTTIGYARVNPGEEKSVKHFMGKLYDIGEDDMYVDLGGSISALDTLTKRIHKGFVSCVVFDKTSDLKPSFSLLELCQEYGVEVIIHNHRL